MEHKLAVEDAKELLQKLEVSHHHPTLVLNALWDAVFARAFHNATLILAYLKLDRIAGSAERF